MFIAIYRMVKDKQHSMRYIVPTVSIAIRCDLSAHDRIVTIILHIVPALPERDILSHSAVGDFLLGFTSLRHEHDNVLSHRAAGNFLFSVYSLST